MSKEDGGLGASGNSRVLDGSESSLGNVVLFWTICVREFLSYTRLPAYVPEIPTKESLHRCQNLLSLPPTAHHPYAHQPNFPERVSGTRFTLKKVYPIVPGKIVLHYHHIPFTL